MPHAGQELHGPNGYRLRLLRTASETGGALLEMEATYPASSQMPPEHMHPRQAESFEVLDGAVLTVIDGQERRYEAGERFEVPARTPHRMAGDGSARMRWEVRPALRTAEFFERIYGGGAPGANLLEEFREEIVLTGR